MRFSWNFLPPNYPRLTLVPLLSRITARTLLAVALLAVVLGLLAVAATQTQIGRDQLARQVEAQFSHQFEGSVAIGRLSGNLLWTLHARDVVVRDPEGRVVIAVDSVVLEPRWRSLLSERLEIRRVHLYRPVVDLVRDTDHGWNLATAFRSRRPASGELGRPLRLDAAEIRLFDGRVTTRNAGPLPEAVADGSIFDYTNTQATGVTGRLVVGMDRRQQRLRVRGLAAELPEQGVELQRLRGLFRIQEGAFSAEAVRLQLGRSSLAGSVRMAAGESPRLRVSRSHLVASELQRLVPAFPVSDASSVELRAEGPLNALRVHRLEVTSAASRVRGRGTLDGLPDSARYAFDLSEIDLRQEDLLGVFPGLLPEGSDLGRLTGSAQLSGAYSWSGPWLLQADGRVDVRADAGRLDGHLGLIAEEGRPLRYAVDAAVVRLDLARLTGEQALASSLTGRVTLAGSGKRGDELDARLRVALERSTLLDRSVGEVRADLVARRGRITGSAALETSGRLEAEGSVDLLRRQLDLTLEATGLDLRSLDPDAPQTSLTGRALVSATGTQLDDLIADASIALSGATVTLADSVWLLPDDPVGIALRPAGRDGPRVRIESSAVTMETAGSFDWLELVAVGRYWGGRFAETAANDLLPRLNGEPRPSLGYATAAPVVPEQVVALKVTALEPHALRPWIGHLEPGTELDLSASVSPERLTAELTVTSEAIGIGATQVNSSHVVMRLAASADGELLDGLWLDLDGTVNRLITGDGLPLNTALTARYRPDGRSLAFTARALRARDSVAVDVDARVAVLGDRFRLDGDFGLEAPGERWRADAAEIDLFTDGLVFREFDARRILPVNAERPGLRLAGTASARASDTLQVHGQSLPLDEVLRFFGLHLPFDGIASADLEITGVLGQPAVLGGATVEDFTIWGDPAGRVVAASQIASGREGFDVDIRVMPSADTAAIGNDGRLAGSLRFPGRMPDGSRDPGFFDLDLDLDRLDLFILNHLFPDLVSRTTGGASGTGTITGDWSFPLFHADLHVENGWTRIPAFNLDLDATGRVSVDREGIHLHDVALRDKKGGAGLVSGGILFNEYRFFSFDLEGRFQEFEIIDVDRSRAGNLPFYGHIRASGSATLSGPIDNVFLRSPDAVTTADSRIFIPVVPAGPVADTGFLVFTDADGRVPEPEVRRSLIGERPEDERPFLEGLEMLLNVRAPSGSTVHLVFDPVVGDVISAVGSARLQLAILEGEFRTYGTFEVERGDYLFTAGDVFTRRFELERGGTLEWSGDPIDAALDLPASYRTRASLAGLGLGAGEERQRMPFVVGLRVGGRVTAPLVDLSIELDESGGRSVAAAEPLRRRLNEPDRQAEYATSVLLTNTFLLVPSDRPLTEAADDLFYTSLSELVSARLNLFLNQALGADNIDVAVGLQQGTGIQDFDLTYGVALRLLDERLIIRGEGVYHQLEDAPASDGLQGEVVVEMRVSEAVSLEVFYRREGDLLLGSGVAGVPIGAYGAGVNYQTEFTTWKRLLQRVFPQPRGSAAEEEDDDEGAGVLATGG